MNLPIGEVWLPVVGYEGLYEVSSHGRIKSLARVSVAPAGVRSGYERAVPERILQVSPRSRYPSATLYRDGVKTRVNGHRVVADAFLGPCPSGQIVCHRDGNRQNNRVGNLRHDTPAANSADMAEHGTLLLGTKNHLAKLTDDDVRAIRSAAGMSQRQLAARYGVSRPAIGFVISRKTWRHISC